MDIAKILSGRLAGRYLTSVERREYDWAFGFGDAAGLGVSCPWRVLVKERIAFAGSDDGHKFGLPAPLDGEAEAKRLFANKAIKSVSIRPDTADLSIIFSDQTVLEVLNMSAGYESWQIGVSGISVIAKGGGELAIYSAAL